MEIEVWLQNTKNTASSQAQHSGKSEVPWTFLEFRTPDNHSLTKT
jgi:hypothetical protein